MSTLIQHPVPEVWPYFVHPQLVDVISIGKLHMLRKIALVVDPSFTLLLIWRPSGFCVRFLDVDNIINHTEFVTFA